MTIGLRSLAIMGRLKAPRDINSRPAPKPRPLPLEFQGAPHACARINSPAPLDRLQYLQRGNEAGIHKSHRRNHNLPIPMRQRTPTQNCCGRYINRSAWRPRFRQYPMEIKVPLIRSRLILGTAGAPRFARGPRAETPPVARRMNSPPAPPR